MMLVGRPPARGRPLLPWSCAMTEFEVLASGFGLAEGPTRADGWVYAADFDSGAVLRGRWSTDTPPRLQRWWSSPSGQADGLAGEAGGVLVALGSGAGVARIHPDGTLDHVLAVPAAFVSSVCFAGERLGDLVITTGGRTGDGQPGGAVLRIPAAVPGLPLPPVTIPTAH
jgi:sugar lactone lactonase YvrE